MLEGKCCICGEHATSLYWSIQHLDIGKSRIYQGHKRCLFLLDDRLSKGETIEFEEIDTPKSNA